MMGDPTPYFDEADFYHKPEQRNVIKSYSKYPGPFSIGFAWADGTGISFIKEPGERLRVDIKGDFEEAAKNFVEYLAEKFNKSHT